MKPHPVSDQSPLVSVVMSVYNGAKFIGKAVESILSQTLRPLELIVVDDGSTDETHEMIASYSAQDSRIKLIRKEHTGLVDSLNTACQLAKGDYVARLDADDIAIKSRLEKQVSYLFRCPKIHLLGGHVDCIDDWGHALFTMKWPSIEQGLIDYMLLDCHISHTAVMFSRHTFSHLGGYRPMFMHAEDYDLFLRFGDNHGIDNLQEVVCQYRLHADQISVDQLRQQIVSGIGARLATRSRRAKMQEPAWLRGVISEEAILSQGISKKRIEGLVREYQYGNQNRAGGWRWSRSPFCSLAATPRDGGS